MATKKEVPLLIRAAGILGALADALARAVLAAGGSLEDIHRLITPAGVGDLAKIARIIASGMREVVNYARSVADSIVACRFDVVATIPEDLFPPQPHEQGEREVGYGYVEFDHDATLEEAWAEMERTGQRPPTARETLRFAEKRPDEQGERPIIGAASAPVADGSCRVLSLYGGAGLRALSLYWALPWHLRWALHYRFLAVRKS